MPDDPINMKGPVMTLRPHQKDLVNQLLEANAPSRFLLSSLPGGGSMTALSAAAGAMLANRGILRCLVIAPSNLGEMWCDQLRSFGCHGATKMTPPAYRRLQADTAQGINVWETLLCAVVSIDFLKLENRMDEVIAAKWDLVILDGFHNYTDSSQRGSAAKMIWSDRRIAIAVVVSSTPIPLAWMVDGPRTTIIHWKLSDLISQQALPQRNIHAVLYTPSEFEQQLAERVSKLVEQIPKSINSQQTAMLLAHRLSSSKYALEQSLRRLLTIDPFGDIELNNWTPDDIKAEAEAITGEKSVLIDPIIGEQILELIEREPSDSKWECFFQLLCRQDVGRTCTGILFTDYPETAEYIEYLVKSRGINVFSFTDSSTAAQMEHAIQESRRVPSLLIVSSPIEGTGINFTNQVFHYDMPWTPRILEQRMGRVERVGSEFNNFDHYIISKQALTTEEFEKLQGSISKIDIIEEA